MIVWIAIRQKVISIAVKFEIHLTMTPSSAWMNDDDTTKEITKNCSSIFEFFTKRFLEFLDFGNFKSLFEN